MRRFVTIAPEQIETRAVEGGDLVIDMALASEHPAERWFGIEILDHSPESVRLGRLNDGASVLFNHDPNELRGIHVPGTARIDPDRRTRAKIQLTSKTQAGRDTIGLVESRMLTKTSVGYAIHKVVEKSKGGKSREIDGALFERMVSKYEPTRDRAGFYRSLGGHVRAEDDMPTYRVVDWEPFENSLVTVPLDPTVGLGRAAEQDKQEFEAREDASTTTAPAAETKGNTMSEAQVAAPAQSAQPKSDPKVDERTAMQIETDRQQAVRNIAAMARIDERIWSRWIYDGVSPNEASKQAIEIQESRKPQESVAHLAMEVKEVRKYSVLRGLRAVSTGDWSDAGLEREASQAVAKKLGRVVGQKSFYVPVDIQTRDLTVATTTAGGFLKATDNMSFIEMLRNDMVVMAMGARRMSGLVGNVTIPKQTGAATGYWLADEATAITESQQTFGQLALTPRTVGALTQISRLLMLQSSPDAEQLVMSDLAQVCAIAVDLAALAGTGTEQPTGITQTASIGAFTGTSLAAAGLLDAQADVASANALRGSLGYVTTPAVAGLLMARPELPSTGTTRMWQGNMQRGSIFGFPAMSSAQMATATMLFGDWSQLVVGEWGILELAASESANTADFHKGITTIRAFYTVDVGVRYAGAFSYSSSIT